MSARPGSCRLTRVPETATVAPGTHSEAMYRFAKACLRLVTVGDSIPKEGENPERTCERYDAAIVDYQQALAAVREPAPPAPEATDGN